MQELNVDFGKICITPKPPGAPMGKVPLSILKELEHQARQNISTLNFTVAFAKTSSSCNATLEKCQHSLKSTFKKVKSQIQKGANPEKAAKRGYEQACEYLDIWNKTVLIQHRALTCLSKSLAHILQRELYTMGNTSLLRREAEMTLLQPHLGETRRQELRNSPFWHSSLFKSQLVKQGEDFLLKKGTSKDSQGFGPYQNKPFRGPYNKKRGSYRKKKVQNGNSRVHQDLPDSRGMGIVDRPYPHPPTLKEIPKVLLQVTGVPVHRPPIRTSHSPPGLYNDSKRSEANGPLQRTQTSPIPGRLADQVPVSGGSPSEHSGSGRSNPVLGVDNKSGEIRTETNSGVFVRGLRIPSRFSPCKTHSREMAHTSGFDPTTQVKTCFDCKMFDVANWVACLNRENGPRGTPSHEALSVSSQGALEISSVVGQPPSLDRSHYSTPRLVTKSHKCDERCRPLSQRPQYPTLYRRLKRTFK